LPSPEPAETRDMPATFAGRTACQNDHTAYERPALRVDLRNQTTAASRHFVGDRVPHSIEMAAPRERLAPERMTSAPRAETFAPSAPFAPRSACENTRSANTRGATAPAKTHPMPREPSPENPRDNLLPGSIEKGSAEKEKNHTKEWQKAVGQVDICDNRPHKPAP